MQVVDDREDMSVKGECPPSRSRQKRTKKKEKLCIGYYRIYGRYFFVAPFLSTGRSLS